MEALRRSGTRPCGTPSSVIEGLRDKANNARAVMGFYKLERDGCHISDITRRHCEYVESEYQDALDMAVSYVEQIREHRGDHQAGLLENRYIDGMSWDEAARRNYYSDKKSAFICAKKALRWLDRNAEPVKV